MHKLIIIVLALVIAIFISDEANAQLVVGIKPQETIAEVPEIFHGTWRITGSFHSYLYVVPEDFIGKTITITATGYQLGDIVCEPDNIRKWQLLAYWYYDYSKINEHDEAFKKLVPAQVPKQLRKNYTKVTEYSLKCPPPDDSFFSLATYHITLRHYEPSDGFIVFEPVKGPEFILEPFKE